LLDFGCGAGSYLQTMAQQGWQVTGLDAAVGAVSHARAEGHTALVGTLPHPELQPGSFDIVTMWHSLEHLHRPVAVLREAYRLLVPGGKLIVATPNIESIPFRIFQQSWFGLDLPRHLTHFTHSTLTAMLQTAGFRTEKVRQLRHSDWLRSSAKQAARAKTGGLFSMLVSLKPVSRLAAWACYALGGSDCIVCVAERPR
jgi:2-polyprenyl-3-methyl-5-hydroxy-6-metoxy-1,4-benzoquinol methylase